MQPNPSSDVKRFDSLPAFSGFGRRLAALFIDGALLIPALWYFELMVVPEGYEFGFRFTNTGLLAVFFYYVVLEGSPLRASLGKLATYQFITNEAGERIGFVHAVGRNLAKFLTLMTLMIGFFTILFTKRGQALHDLLSRTCVMTNLKT